MNTQSKELYINMGNDIPTWNDLYTYEDQDDDVKQFWEEEARKLMEGVTINGVYIHPWLYWHINFWKMMIDVGDDRIPGNSQLRDNEWMFAEFLKQAEEENKGIFMFGCRRFGKALLNSEILYMEDREKTIGNVVVGDMIYDDKGNLVEVIGVYPQGKVMTYRVTFEDGRNIICCGNHQWKVKHGNRWSVKSLKGIIASDYTNMSIPIGEAINYKTIKLPIPPCSYATMIAAHLSGYGVDMYIDKNICKKYLRSSPDQKRNFIESFIRFFNNVVTGEDEVSISNMDMEVIHFVQRMFWSAGWYAKIENGKFILSSNKKDLKIVSISVYGKQPATCITVNNDSHLFLTTNYVVTHNTAIMSSYLARNATMTYNLTHNVIGSSKEDLMSLGEYLEFGLDNIHPYLRINRTGNDWFKEVIMGTKNVNNIRDIHARIRITNIDSGKAGASLKTASGTPYTSIYDEVGKFPFLAAYLQGRPAHMMHGRMRGMMLCSGTGGNVEKSQDAQKVMNSPAEYGFIVMNYDLVNRRCLKPTWRIGPTACFVPAQMSHAYDKKNTTLDKYLGIDKAPGLKKIDIRVSNFDDNTAKIKSRLDELVKKDRALYVQERMAFPLSVDDCFLNTNVNRFPVEDALKQKNRLLEEGRPGKTVDVYQTDGMRMGYNFSDKQLADYPFQGGNIEAPVVIYEDAPEEGGVFDYTYVSGCLLPGEKVLTDKGWKSVEDVTYDDKLVNKDGEYVSINKRLVYDKKEEYIYGISMYNGVSITRFTKEHPLYVSENNLLNKKYICEDLFDFKFVNVSDVKKSMWVKYPNVYKKEVVPCVDLFPFEITEDIWYLIGAWIGNGYSRIDKYHVGISISTYNGNDDFINRIDDICRNSLGRWTNKRIRDNSCEIFCEAKEFAIWINNTFGKYANGKFIPEWVKFIPSKYKVAFLCGYIDTDGCCYKVNDNGIFNVEYTSCNITLIEDIQDILFSIGIVSSVKVNKNNRSGKIKGHCKKSNCLYHLSFGSNGILILLKLGADSIKVNNVFVPKKIASAKKRGCFISSDGNYIYIRIKNIDKSLYSGKVYNFDCDTHTYICKHITTHNCDPYKTEKADTDSVGAFYVLKRHVRINDPFAYKIVASYVSRPSSSDDFCRTCEILQEAYGAMCLMENADRMYEMYLARRNKQLMLLEDGEKLAGKIIRAGARQNNKLGLSPTVPNQRMLFNTVIQYCWEEEVIGYDDDGNEVTQKGIYRIDDIELLDEIISFGPGVNTDRIIAFGHALLLAKYYDDMGFMPKSTTEKKNEEKRTRKLNNQIKGFTVRRHNPFKMR